MLIAGVLCLCAALASAISATWSVSQPPTAETGRLALRAMAPTQFAAAIMLAAGGVVGLTASPPTAVVVVIVCVAGAFGTLAAGSWQSARYLLARQAADPDPDACTGSCESCAFSCH
ncbi:hypothetical protein MB901379_00056 [Mycobacterium basiliense]|uniref:4Fe-4S ferredoxin-type domain-containing protein n=1 Tax=Mycobacterium basiliense TaxID=2094119 RepID=A0A3S4FJF1_9MYCO|nr:hypothetical protein [Mycobacterium basiliense]VDM86537.1 hypothetical protein MB901379_00056 [Mycobacterium basiliense]